MNVNVVIKYILQVTSLISFVPEVPKTGEQ